MSNRYNLRTDYGIEVVGRQFKKSNQFWKPNDADAILWFDGTRKIEKKNGRVKSWTSRSKFSQKAEQGSASKRPYLDKLNHRNVLNFKNETFLSLGTDFVYPIGRGFTILTMIYVPENGNPNFGWVFDFGNYPESGYGLSVTKKKITFYTPTYLDGGVTSFSHKKAGSWQILMCSVEYGLVQEIGFVDRFPYAKDKTNLVQIDTSGIRNESKRDEYGGPFTLGVKSETDKNQYFSGSIAELFMLPTNLEYYQSVGVNYLADKWIEYR